MQINNINNIFQHNNNIQQNKKPQKSFLSDSLSINYAKLPSTNNFLAFLGGYSLNLRETYQNLDPESYPLDIKENVEKTLETNPTKTLNDVHYVKYKGVLDCFSLEELKEKYPEFQDVNSAYEVEARQESFIGKFQNDELELFPSDEDLSLQLIKLYWGKGLSLNDLSNYIQENSKDNETKNLYYTMHDKLNIPIMDRKYAVVLKLSDKEYNEKFSNTLSEKIKEANDRRIQQTEGEPVYIPRGPLSEAHKQHISEGLKKFYANNPTKIYEMSETQKEYWKNNPKEKERFSEVLDYAWNRTNEGKSLKKHISKFARKFNREITDKKLSLEVPLSKEDEKFITAFWKRNTWANSAWSKAMAKGYSYHSKLADEYFTGASKEDLIFYSVLPTQIAKKVSNYAKTKGMQLTPNEIKRSCADTKGILSEKKVQDFIRNVNRLIDEYFAKKNSIESDLIANSRLNTFIEFKNDLESSQENLPDSFKKNNLSIYQMNFILEQYFAKCPIYNIDTNGNKIPRIGVTNNELLGIYATVLEVALANNNTDIGEYLSKLLDKNYEKNEKRLKALGQI